MRFPEVPTILVLLVATDGEVWLPEVLKGLAAQEGIDLEVLAVDNASTDGSQKIVRKAFGPERVITLERRVGYGRALAVGLQHAADNSFEADAVLLLHDDAALRPGSLEAMIDALRADGVGIVGAKLVDWEDELVLQDIGRTTDRYGRIVDRVERGELDQGQHEGVHEVLYATSAAMLVSTRLIQEVGLFDLRYVALRDDLDLCWRARLAGYRTVVTTAASARHAAATITGDRTGPVRRRVRYFGDRNMLATLIKNYSARRLTLALPVTIMVSLVNAVLYLARGRRSSAFQVLEALRWNLTHLPSTLRARRRAQSTRSVPDAEVAALMHHGATRVRSQIERAVESVMGEIDEVTDEDLEAPPTRLIDRMRAHPGAVAVVVASIVALLGIRPLLASGPVAGVDMPPFPGSFTDLFQEYASGWRGAGAGGAGPATPGLILLGALMMLTLGSGWLAQRALLFGLPVVGAIGIMRVASAMGIEAGGRRIAALLYGASPLMLGTFGAGRLPDLILLGAAPWLVLPIFRAARVIPRGGWRSTAAGVAGAAVVVSLSPWALVFIIGVAAVVAMATPDRRVGVARTGGLIAVGAAGLLVPWAVELFRPGSPIGSGGPQRAGMAELLALMPGSVRPVPLALGFGIIVAAMIGWMVAPVPTRRTANTLGALAVFGLFASWAVARGVPWIAPRPGLPLVVVSLAAALLAAIGFVVASATLADKTFGAAHVLAIGVGAILAVQIAATAGWVAFGDRPGLVTGDSLALASLRDEAATDGDFRVVWIGGTGERPVAAMTGPAGDSMRQYLARRGGVGDDVLRSTVGAMMSGATDHAGRTLATMGVRYVIVRPEADRTVRRAVASQPDLDFVQRLRPPGEVETVGEDLMATGTLVYRNAAGAPIASVTTSPRWISASESGFSDVTLAEPAPKIDSAFSRQAPGVYRGTMGSGGIILLAEDFSVWRARVGETVLTPTRSFGWATRFEPPPDPEAAEAREVLIWFDGQRWHRGAILVNALVIVLFWMWRSQRMARDRGER